MSGKNRNMLMLAGIAAVICWAVSGCIANLPSQGDSKEPPTSEAVANSSSGESAVAGSLQSADGTAGDTGLGEAQNPDTLSIPPGTTFDNPWRYCEAVQTVESPGVEYVGEKPPSAVRSKTLLMAGIRESDGSAHTIVWRCMDSAVYGCDVTLSTHCLTKMTLLTEPTRAMLDECAKLEDGAVLPTDVTGVNTPYEWTCIGKKPTITAQGVTVDSQGFNANIWYQLYEN